MPIEIGMSEMIKNGREDNIISMQNPDCVNCNECCSMGTMLTDDEFVRLKRFLKKDKRGKAFFNQGQRLIMDHIKNDIIYWICPFSVNKRCRIYNTRPNICRIFHCDEPEQSKAYRDKYNIKCYTIGDLFHIKEIVISTKQGNR